MARWAIGTKLQMSDGQTPGTFATIAEVLDISGGGFSVATEDATNMDSPDGWAERIPTVITPSDVTFQVQYDPTDPTHDDQTGLWGVGAKRELRTFRLVPPIEGAKAVEFDAFVTNVGPSFPVQGKMVADITLTPTGKIRWVEPS